MKKMAFVLCFVLLIGVFVPQSALSFSVYAQDQETDVPSATENTTPALSEEAKTALQTMTQEREVMALVYLTDSYSVKNAPLEDVAEVAVLPSGQQVFVQEAVLDEWGQLWLSVSFYVDEVMMTGYIQRNNLAISDERFLAWEEENIAALPAPMLFSSAANVRSVSADIAQFPASYQASLLALKQAHPNWTFVRMDTGLDWNEVVSAQMEDGRSWIPSSFDESMILSPTNVTGWSYASQTAVEYYLDPRNWLDDTYVFQFEQLTYNPSYHTEAAVQNMLAHSFMNKVVPGDSRTYARLFVDIGGDLGVSPFHLASRAYHEQGVHGTSSLISGTEPGYENLYNYYNISASGNTNAELVVNGLTKAREMGWTSHTLSIQGGADIISANYIRQGQDTLYLQKFDVDDSYNGLYWHQYMQSLFAPSSEGKQIRNLYEDTGALDSTFVFKIPVYSNMPGTSTNVPTTGEAGTNRVSLTVPNGYDASKIYLDGIEYAATVQNGQAIASAGANSAKTAIMYQYDANGVPVGMYVWLLYNESNTYTATPVPELENLISYHGFSARVTGDTGIRFKSGISSDLRQRFLAGGVANFQLKEYGTLVMTSSNLASHHFVLGGDKVAGGIAYGTNSSGNVVDSVFAEVDGRTHYTSVLTGLPPEQYKTELAFRGYITLIAHGQEYTFYGPPRSNSIYNIATSVISSGYYGTGTSESAFLQEIIQNAV